MPELIALATAKLAESGLTPADAVALKIDLLDAPAVQSLIDVAMPALRFTYHTLDGAPRDDLYRLRTLGPPPVGAFGEQANPPRYSQPKGSPVGIYYPQNCSMSWRQVAASADVSLVLTEGELKAAAGCKAGIITLALGGVWSWCCRKEGTSFLPDLAAFTWGRRTVTLCFDSDATRNHHIAQASAALVAELRDRGAIVQVVELPELVKGQKTGLDDFLVARGPEALRKVLNAAQPLDELGVKLLEFNGRYIYLDDPARLIYDTVDDRLIPSDAFLESRGNIKALKVAPGPGPTGQKRTMVKVAREWLDWPFRRTYASMTYLPGAERILNGTPGVYRINKWSGWGAVPVPGDVTPWIQLLDHLFTGGDPRGRIWFERWCAYPFQHPGAKLTSACGIWSKSQGQGKSLIGDTLGVLYGSNYIAISDRELEGTFNFWAVGKQLVMVDDMSTHDSRAHADVLKKQITQKEILINVKYTPQYTLPDCVNYYMTSNRVNAFFVEQEDRRFFIHEVITKRLPQPFYDAYHRWLETTGPGALLAYFLALDLGDFSAFTPPPWTEAKQKMIDAVRSDLDAWVAELKGDPDGKLRRGDMVLPRDLYTARELMDYYTLEKCGHQPSITAMANALGEQFVQVHGGQPVKVDGKLGRYWAVRNGDRWATATLADIVTHIVTARPVESRSGS